MDSSCHSMNSKGPSIRPLQKQSASIRHTCDRFIPARGSMDLDVARFMITKKEKENDDTHIPSLSSSPSPFKKAYKKELAATLFKNANVVDNNCRILSFKGKASTASQSSQQHMSGNLPISRRASRYIPQSADRTLDAPDLLDDYYLNLLDWSSTNVLSVALGNTVYLWDASECSISELLIADVEEGPVTSVGWAPDGRQIAVGLNNSVVQLWDSASDKKLRALKGHHERVGALAWSGPILTTGGLDGIIINHDVRIREHIVQTYKGHVQEVCGLKWSPSGQQLASGGNDNLLYIWDRSMASHNSSSQYLHQLDEHCAAVKAMAWCPFQNNLLASGGGNSDGSIKFWNTHEDAQENEMEDRRTAENRSNCEECGKNPWKYKCPGCALRSCGLPCVKAHKERTQCTGKRNRAQFVPISQFDDNWLVSDYNLLEEALRITEAAKRSRAPLGDIRRFPSRPRKAFQNQARNRNTELLFLPKGMSKNETNRSYYNKWRKCIYWTVEWQFHSTDVIFIDHGVDEHVSLQRILEKHLSIGPGNPVSRHKLRHFCKESTENLKLFVKIEYTKGTKSLYFELNITEPLRSQLAGKTIIEYPVIHVVLPAHSIQFEVLKHLDRVPEKVVKSSTVDKMEDQKLDDLFHLEGVPFREEEIEGEFEAFRDLDPVPEKAGKPSTVDKMEHQILGDLVHREGPPFREEKNEEGEFEVLRDLDSVLEKLVKPSTIDKMEDQDPDDLVHQEGVPFREEEIEEGEFEDFRDFDPVPEVVKPQNVDKMEDQNLDDLVHREGVPFKEEEIDEEFEIFRDLYPVPEKIVKPATIDELEGQNLDDLIHLQRVPFREEEIEEGEFVSNWDFDEDYIGR